MAEAGAEIALWIDRIMTTEDPEGPHGARVALRRIRAALRGFAPLIDRKVLRAVTDRARRLARMIGELRDADVSVALGAGLAGGPDILASRHRIRAALREELRACRAEEYGPDLQRLFASSEWKRRGSRARRWRKGPVRRLARRALDRAWRRAARFGASVSALRAPARHKLRKRLKTLRYLTEYFSDLWPGEASATFLGRLRILQDELGTLTDIAMIEALAVDDTADWSRTQARAGAALQKADWTWRKIRKRCPFWT